MRKKGIVSMLAGLVLTVTGFVSIQFAEKNPVPYFILVAGVLLLFLGLSFLFFDQPLAKRKRSAATLLCIGLVLCAFVFAAFIFNWNIPGLSPLVVFIGCYLSFSYFPLLTRNRIEKWKEYTNATWHAVFLSVGDLLGFAGLIMGILFKRMHWPGATFLIILGLVILGFSLVGWNKLFGKQIVLRKSAEEKVRETLMEVAEKNKEITDSINYAKRIQNAILPSQDFIKAHLPDSFVYYQPKDIVAGDFYWAEKWGDTFFIAAADCTGHGVPGALVSVVCCNALNRSLKEFMLVEPGQILDKTRELVLESFSKGGGVIQDGMDISLISIQGNEIKWAGANNPLWYVQASGSVINEIKADKQPIGYSDHPRPFTTHILKLEKGDCLYLFTDGYPDQFGGLNGKKFKYKQFEELLASGQQLPMNEQFNQIVWRLNEWKGSLEQVDDLCVIGIRL